MSRGMKKCRNEELELGVWEAEEWGEHIWHWVSLGLMLDK
jgi:hypothetical protein